MSSCLVNLRFLDFKEATRDYLDGKTSDLSNKIFQGLRTNCDFQNRSGTILRTKSNIKVNYPEITNEMGRTFGYIGYIPNDGLHYTRYVDDQPLNCMYCLRGRADFPGDPWNIVIAKEYDQHGEIYHGIDIFCCPECTLTETNNRILTGCTLYQNSVMLLHEVYTRRTGRPSSELKPASDRRLLKLWNGPLTHQQFHSCHGQYGSNMTHIRSQVSVQLMEKNM